LLNWFGFTRSSKIFESAGAFLDKAFYSLLTSFGTILLTSGGAFVGSYKHNEAFEAVGGVASFITYLLSNPYLGFIIGAPALLIGGLGIYRDQRTLESENKVLREKNDEVELIRTSLNSSQEEVENLKSEIYFIHQKLVETWLKGISKQIQLDTFSRVTIYFENAESFTMLARYSSNPKLAKKHKLKFELNQGVISKAWEHGEYIENKSPSFEDKPKEYIDYMSKKYSYSEKQLKDMNMKSCFYFALSITEADDNIGVILFESEKSHAFNEEMMTTIRNYCSDYQSHLCGFVRDGLLYDRSALIEAESKTSDNDAEILNILEGKE